MRSYQKKIQKLAKEIFISTYNNDYFKTNNDVISNDHERFTCDKGEIFSVDNISDNLEIEEYLKKLGEHIKTDPLVSWWKVNSKYQIVFLCINLIISTFNILKNTDEQKNLPMPFKYG
jgi:hypothetical protein